MRTYVFDTSAIIALFDYHPKTARIFQEAEADRANLWLPTAAVAEAGRILGAGPEAWELLQHTPVTFVPLGETAAVNIGLWPADLGIRHAVWEARAALADEGTDTTIYRQHGPAGYCGAKVISAVSRVVPRRPGALCHFQ